MGCLAGAPLLTRVVAQLSVVVRRAGLGYKVESTVRTCGSIRVVVTHVTRVMRLPAQYNGKKINSGVAVLPLGHKGPFMVYDKGPMKRL